MTLRRILLAIIVLAGISGAAIAQFGHRPETVEELLARKDRERQAWWREVGEACRAQGPYGCRTLIADPAK